MVAVSPIEGQFVTIKMGDIPQKPQTHKTQKFTDTQTRRLVEVLTDPPAH